MFGWGIRGGQGMGSGGGFGLQGKGWLVSGLTVFKNVGDMCVESADVVDLLYV